MAHQRDIETLFRDNFQPMFTMALRMLHDEEHARDVVHNVFASLLAEPRETVTRAWLLNAVRFQCIKYLRGLSLRQRFEDGYALFLSETDDFCDFTDEQINRLNRFIKNELPERTREVLLMKFVQNLKYREIAQLLQISEVAVYKHLRNALNALRQYFNHYEP